MAGKIDVHNHTVPEFYRTALSAAGWRVGAPAQHWDEDTTLSSMEKQDIGIAVLSLSAPGAKVAGSHAEGRALARKWNDYTHGLCISRPTRFGHFGALPSLSDTSGALAEIQYALDELKCDGVTLFTSYDGKYLGHEDFAPIWAELNKRRAVVFVHPSHIPAPPKGASSLLPQPIIDFPHETTRAACDLITSGSKRQNPDCKVILSHAGGTLPYLASRVEALSTTLFGHLSVEGAPRGEQITEDAKSFYFDTALSGTANILDTFLKWAPADRILFGSDTPYATVEAEWNTKALGEYPMEEKLRQKIYRDNAIRLFPRLGARA